MDEAFKTCGCGRKFDRQAWEALPDSKIYHAADGGLNDQRRCECGSHITAALIPAMKADDLERASRLVNRLNRAFVRLYSAQELLHLCSVTWLARKREQQRHGDHGWSLDPDEWTSQQLSAALERGVLPEFTETIEGEFHAVGVTDCVCGDCKKVKR